MAVSDETTDLVGSTSTPVATFHTQRAGIWEEILLSVTTAPSGSAITGDVHKNGTTIFSTKPVIDEDDKTSIGSAITPVLTAATFAKGDIVELFCDSVGTTTKGTGLKFYFNQYYI